MEWENDLYDFSDPEVRLKYVPQLGCSAGIHTPKHSNGVSLGILLYLIGTSVGPVLAGIFLQANHTVLPLIGSFPAPQAYNLIFLTATLMSILSIALVGTITGRKAKPKFVMK